MFRSIRSTLLTCAAIAALLICAGCGDDDPVDPGADGAWVEFEVQSGSYYRNRFFRLTSEAEPQRIPMAAIDVNSIRIFKLLPGGEIQPGEVANIAAYADTLGQWNGVDFAAEVAFASSRWRQLELNTDLASPYCSLLADMEGYLWALDLISDQGDAAVMAVTFTWNGGEFRVGDDVNAPPEGTVIINGSQAEGLWYRMKLLQAPIGEPDPFAHALMVRQIYPLGSYHIDLAGFDLRIDRVDPTTDTPWNDENDVPYLRVFGLDTGDDWGVGAPDGRPDLNRAALFDLGSGMLIFPESFATPFAATEAQYRANAGADIAWGPGTYLREHQAPQLYAEGTSRDDLMQSGYFSIVARRYIRND